MRVSLFLMCSLLSLGITITASAQTVSGPIEPRAGTWKTWVLKSGSELRLPPPPDTSATANEIQELRALAGRRDAAALERIRYWDFSSPAYRWNEMLTDTAAPQNFGAGVLHRLSDEVSRRLAEQGLDRNAPRAARAYALVHVAHYDAWIASQDAKFHYWTARPNEFDPTITTVVPNPNFPTYVSNAATLGMAPGLVLFPREAARYRALAHEFGESRLWAGIHFRSDIDAGYAIGRNVAQKVIERAKSDATE
jgi:hypothetical protein